MKTIRSHNKIFKYGRQWYLSFFAAKSDCQDGDKPRYDYGMKLWYIEKRGGRGFWRLE